MIAMSIISLPTIVIKFIAAKFLFFTSLNKRACSPHVLLKIRGRHFPDDLNLISRRNWCKQAIFLKFAPKSSASWFERIRATVSNFERVTQKNGISFL